MGLDDTVQEGRLRLGPAPDQLRILFFSGWIANICNRERPARRQVGRSHQIHVPVKPSRDGPIELAVAGGFDATAEGREVCPKRFHGSAVFFGMLHRVAVNEQVVH